MVLGRYVSTLYSSDRLSCRGYFRCGKVSDLMDGDVPRRPLSYLRVITIACLMDDIALKVYDAFAYHVTQANFNHRVKTVSLWSLQMTASAVLAALRSVVDPVSVQVRDLYQDAVSVLDVEAADALVAPVGA